jgi:hypothetical protein
VDEQRDILSNQYMLEDGNHHSPRFIDAAYFEVDDGVVTFYDGNNELIAVSRDWSAVFKQLIKKTQ